MVFPARSEVQTFESYARDNPARGVEDIPALWGETARAGLAQVLNEERTDSNARALNPHIETRAKAITERGGDERLAMHYIGNLDKAERLARIIDNVGPEQARRFEPDPLIVDAILQAREFSAQYPGEVLSDDEIHAQVTAELAEARKQNQAIMARGPGSAAFLGQTAGLVSDPLILATLPAGPGWIAGRGVAGNALRAFGSEALIAGAVEVPVQAQVMQFKAEIDSPWSFQDAAVNVLSATLGAGVIRGAGSATIDVAGPLLKRYQKLPARLKTDESEAAAGILQAIDDMARDNPLASLPPAGELPGGTRQAFEEAARIANNRHFEAIDKARAQLEAGEPIAVGDVVRNVEDTLPLDQVSRLGEADTATLSPDALLVDATRFQFKAGGDTEGVTDALAGVTRFDRSLAGQVLAWEDTAGKIFVVDGHQRLGLAKRALAAGQDPAEVQLPTFILREADGISELDAMRVGAIRNLTASTGSALDAAKVLRGIGPAGEAMLPPLPPNGAVLRQGRFLSRLGDDAFTAVVNELIPERQGAIIGELLSDPLHQSAAVQALARLKPANDTQARAMIEQMRAAGFRKQTTGDLFGEREIATSLIRERARVIDAALKQSKQDRQTFGRLVSRGTEIESTGANRLDSEANKAKVDESGQAIEILTRLANTAGPVSDAIGEAAEAVAKGAKPADVIEPVLEAIGRPAAKRDTGGGAPGAARAGEEFVGSEEVGPGTDGFVFEPNSRLTPEEAEIEARFIEFLETTPWPELKAKYATLEDTGGGRILSADAARELSDDYLANRALSNAVHEPSSAFIKRLYSERLAEAAKAGERAEVAFTAGGTGSGKTSALRLLGVAEDAQIVYDTNLAKFGSGKKKIDQALAAGKTVSIDFVHRDPIESLVNGALPRAMRQEAEHGTGRTVPVATHASTHAGSNATVRQLAEAYADDPRVTITIIDNSNGKGKAALSTVDKLPELDQNAILQEAINAVEVARSNGEISEAVAKGFAGEQAGRAQAQPGDGRIAEPGSPQEPGAPAEAAARTDPITLPERPRAGRPDEGGATGFVDDADYDRVLAQFDLLNEEAGDLVEITRVGTDEFGSVQTETVSARQVMDDLDARERALADIEACA